MRPDLLLHDPDPKKGKDAKDIKGRRSRESMREKGGSPMTSTTKERKEARDE